jgi:hypothetical protein
MMISELTISIALLMANDFPGSGNETTFHLSLSISESSRKFFAILAVLSFEPDSITNISTSIISIISLVIESIS